MKQLGHAAIAAARNFQFDKDHPQQQGNHAHRVPGPEEFKRPTDFRVDVQKGIHARARTGGTIALAESDEYPVEGTMPDGEPYTATVCVTRPHTLVMLKLLALVDRHHNTRGRRRRGTIRDRDFASVDPRSEFRFAARAVP